MAGEIVQYHQVAGVQSRGQEVLAKTGESDAIDRPIENHGGPRAVQSHAMNQRVGLPVSAGNRFHQTVAPFRPAAKSSHVGFQTGFIDENQLFGIDLSLATAPVRPLDRDVLSILLRGPRRLF